MTNCTVTKLSTIIRYYMYHLLLFQEPSLALPNIYCIYPVALKDGYFGGEVESI